MERIMMKIAVVLALIGLVHAENLGPEDETVIDSESGKPMQLQSRRPFLYYHSEVGIPLAKQIYDMEMAMKAHREISKENLEGRIVNGVLTAPGQHPYFVGIVIYFKNGYISICGSSMLSNTKTLTAGHCWFDGKDTPGLFELIFGATTIYYGGYRTNTSNVLVHERYTHDPLRNDIAVITHQYVAYNRNIKKIALPVSRSTFVGSRATATGFGRTHNLNNPRGDDDYYQPKRHVTIQVISDKECANYLNIAPGQHICTQGTAGGPIGTCQGDSGGPLTLVQNGVTVLIGVTSFGAYLCDQPPYADAYARITYYIFWIKSKL